MKGERIILINQLILINALEYHASYKLLCDINFSIIFSKTRSTNETLINFQTEYY